MIEKQKATAFAVLAAALYAVNIPVSKLLLNYVQPTVMAAFLYLGAGVGLLLYSAAKGCIKTENRDKTDRLTKKELPYTVAMVVLDIAAPILLMFGITDTNSANVSLLNNFEIVATSIIALAVFKEFISKRLWLSIALVTAASIILSFEDKSALVFNKGSMLVLGACVCWGFENNCTKMISNKSSVEIVTIKGCFSGLGSLIIAFIAGEGLPAVEWLVCVMLLGFVAYGLSINFYIKAQKQLGAAKTSAYYSVAPFMGVLFGMLLLGEQPNMRFYVALLIMLAGTLIMAWDTITVEHLHEHKELHEHEHIHAADV